MKLACLCLALVLVMPVRSASLRDHVRTFGTFVMHMMGVSQPNKPSFCSYLDCPSFTLVNKTDDYEERLYTGTSWVSTSIENIDYDDASSTLFMRLFRYISGTNARGEKIDMTVPVLNRIIPGAGPACESNFTMSFFISPSVTNPPAPSEPTVFLNTMKPMRVYVRSFGGYAKMSDWIEQAEALSQALPESVRYHTDFYYTAGYDAPFKFFNRHNEIWFIAM